MKSKQIPAEAFNSAGTELAPLVQNSKKTHYTDVMLI